MHAITRRAVSGAVFAAALVALLSMMTRGAAQTMNLVATPDKAATVQIAQPRKSAGMFLDLWVKAYTPPRRGAVEAVVTLTAGGQEVEIGRFAVFPSEPFFATEAWQQRAYRFDATAALAALEARDGPLIVQVRLVPVEASVSPEGAQLTLSKVELSPRR
jgi:hypothetical protein